MSETKQAVVEADSEAPLSDNVDNAQDDLDSLLSEFDQEAKPIVEPKPEQNDDLVRSWVEQQIQKENQKETKSDIKSAVDVIKGGLEVSLPDIAVEGILYSVVENDPRALEVWKARKSDPGSWNKLLDGVKSKVNKEFTDLPDKKLTDDRDAVTSAVHSASKHELQETEVDWSMLSDQEFAMQKAKLSRKK
jgi:hypothetical protein